MFKTALYETAGSTTHKHFLYTFSTKTRRKMFSENVLFSLASQQMLQKKGLQSKFTHKHDVSSWML